jgi:outer membrane protein OmpA-like peptidoglycan-associated protein/predicted nuclease with TOPRIM domain
MTRDDSRVHRIARIWLGPSLATLVGIGSTAEPAAMPIPAARVELSGPTLIQQSPGPSTEAQQPAGTPPPPSADESPPDSFIELHEALTAARQRLGDLSKVTKAVAATGQLQRELAALRQDNEQLRAEIDAVRAERGDLETATQAAEAHAAELTRAAEDATAKVREKDEELAALRTESEQRIAAADAARAEAEARLGEMRDRLQRAEQEKARIGADLAQVEGELASTKEQATAAGQEQAQLDRRVAALEDERDDLRTRLAEVTAQLEPGEAAKTRLEREVAELRQAARTAAADTRQLIAALAAIGLAAGPLEADAALLAESGTPSAGERADGEGRQAATAVGNVAAVAAPSQGDVAAVAAPSQGDVAAVAAPSQSPQSGSVDADLERTETASGARPGDGDAAHLDQRGILGGRPAVFSMLAGLPPEKRQHVQGLLAYIPSKLEERGLMTTVPGELLFGAGSDEVQPGAYDTLAKVAELIGMYDDRQVLIIGHSDARGDADRNKELSERRAERVKQVFVDYFQLPADRLLTEGQGDARPIASNATPQGRQANRRVEILILN